jgi:hypothetical protein
MNLEPQILEQAKQCVSREQSSIRAEEEAFREFRKTVARGRARGAPSSGATETDQLRKAYRETVMSTPDFESAYEESLREHLENEFMSSVADVLLSERDITPRIRRKILIASNTAIEQREQFYKTLEIEEQSLQTTQRTLTEIRQELQSLSRRSMSNLTFEELFDAWESYGELASRCDQLLKERQSILDEIHDTEGHPLNKYLYSELEAEYPALHAIGHTYQHIKRCQQNLSTGPKTESRTSNNLTDGPIPSE